ncbi:MAG TPA: isoprenylcysteine carboxylmethyltransferase family protein [Bryobacteraceae bacterium]|nr:isoprenylcysteine carboxylmethyltransferase family protein [Bryobacteraceae bacterium]
MPDASRALTKRALSSSVRFLIFFWMMLFLPAWSLHFWQAWVFWFLFSACILFTTLYFLRRDPALVERRMKAGPAAEREKSQKRIQTLVSLFLFAEIVLPGFDHRFGWSTAPAALMIVGNVFAVVGFAITFLALKENTFASAIIEVNQSQRVISTGPYRLVRHPLYSGALLMMLAAPVALGSYWAFLAVPPVILGIVWRLIDEEKFLGKNLPGYDEYRQKTRYRLVPLIW